MVVTELKLEQVRPRILTGPQWNELKHCGIPYNQLWWAINRELNTIPEAFAKDWAEKIRRNPHNILVLLGPTGVGKTTLGIRYMVKKISEGLSPVIYIPRYILEGLKLQELKITLKHHEILGYSTEITSIYNKTDGEVVTLKELAHRYRLIMLDDITEDDFDYLNELIEQVYQTGSTIVITTNIPTETFRKSLSERARSRMRVLAYALELTGEDLRRGAKDE